jgi:hypothetical protein
MTCSAVGAPLGPVPPSVVAVPVDVDVFVAVAVEADPEPPETLDPEPPDVPVVDPEPEAPEAPDVPDVDVVVDVAVEVAVLEGDWLPDAERLLLFEVEPHAATTVVTSTRPETGERRMLLKDPRARGEIHARSRKGTSNAGEPTSRFGLVWRRESLPVIDTERFRRLNKSNVQSKRFIAVWLVVNGVGESRAGAIFR